MNVNMLHHLCAKTRALVLLLASASTVAACSGDPGDDLEHYAEETSSDPSHEAAGEPAAYGTTDDGMTEEPGPEADALGVARQALTQSFRASCRNVNGIIAETFQDFTAECRRINGRFVNAAFVGSCRGDIANCNGFLRCGRC